MTEFSTLQGAQAQVIAASRLSASCQILRKSPPPLIRQVALVAAPVGGEPLHPPPRVLLSTRENPGGRDERDLALQEETNPSADRAFLGEMKDVTSLARTALQSENQYADTLLGN